jgi:RHS repeat-associated protein
MTNASGAEVESTEYMPFGGIRNHTGTNTSNYKFTDQELDGGNGLYNYDARIYDPFIGRFISADPIVPVKGDAVNF